MNHNKGPDSKRYGTNVQLLLKSTTAAEKSHRKLSSEYRFPPEKGAHPFLRKQDGERVENQAR